jgi:hypothetical protein
MHRRLRRKLRAFSVILRWLPRCPDEGSRQSRTLGPRPQIGAAEAGSRRPVRQGNVRRHSRMEFVRGTPRKDRHQLVAVGPRRCDAAQNSLAGDGRQYEPTRREPRPTAEHDRSRLTPRVPSQRCGADTATARPDRRTVHDPLSSRAETVSTRRTPPNARTPRDASRHRSAEWPRRHDARAERSV